MDSIKRSNMKALGLVIAMGVVALAGSANAQTLTILHSFGATLQDGQGPGVGAPVIAVGSTLYGTTGAGGTNNHGIIFSVSTDGSSYSNLHQFGAIGDGLLPQAGLTLAGSTLYGTTSQGGTNNSRGTLFAINTDGSDYTILHEFGATGDGWGPGAGLTLVGSTLYGTTRGSSLNTYGTIFSINTNGSDYTVVYQFGSTIANDGQNAYGVLTLTGSTLYGTTREGGTHMEGTVFAIDTNGSNYAILYDLGATGKDGQNPEASLTLAGSTLYGTTFYGGGVHNGTVFAINTNGSGFTNLYQFATTNYFDGYEPSASLTLLGSTLYGTTFAGGGNGIFGTIFTVNTNGSHYTILYGFGSAGANDAREPESALTLVGSTFYGTSFAGGAYGAGTVFKFDPGLGGGGGGSNCTYSINQTNVAVAAASGSASISVTAPNGCPWTAVSNDGFITITAGSSGTGNGMVHYSVAANTNTTGRIGTITIEDQTLTVTQSGAAAETCTFTLSPASITLPAKGGAKNVSVKVTGSDCSWTATSDDPFISITSGSPGTGSGKVVFTVAGNTNTTPLTGTIKIADKTFTVNQLAGGCQFKLSPKAGKIKSTGGTGTVKVTPTLSDCDWTAVSNDPFIMITTGGSGTGKGAVTYTVTPNTNTTTVTGTITIAGQPYPVTEAAAK